MDKIRTSLKRLNSEKQNLLHHNNDSTNYNSARKSRKGSKHSVGSITSINDVPVVKVRADTSTPSSIYDQAASISIDFEQVPFKLFSKTKSTIKAKYLETFLVTLTCMFAPCVFVFIAFIINELLLRNHRRMPAEEKKSQRNIFFILMMIALIKDFIIITIVVHFMFDTPASNIEVAYAPIAFLWSVFLFGVPFLISRYSDSRYIFRNEHSKTGVTITSPCISHKTRMYEDKKMEEQEKRFRDEFESLLTINEPSKERIFVLNNTPKHVVYICTLSAIIVALIRTFVPLYQQTMHPPIFANEFNKSRLSINTWTPRYLIVNNHQVLVSTVYYSVITLSAINSLTTSLLAVFNYISVLLWKFLLLSEWKHFNRNERCNNPTLVNHGPHGIVIWWKTFQSLKFYTSSPKCMYVMISNMVYLVCTILVVVISMQLLFITAQFDVRVSVSILLLNNWLLYLVILLLTFVTLLCRFQVNEAYQLIRIKKLNIAYEIGVLMSLEQEILEHEPSVPIKVRSLKGCLMLIQELTTVMCDIKDDTNFYIVILCVIITTAFIFSSTFVASRYLLLYSK